MAIVRYLSRKANLQVSMIATAYKKCSDIFDRLVQGDTDADFAISEMLLEEFNDIFTTVAKVHTTRAIVNVLSLDSPLSLV